MGLIRSAAALFLLAPLAACQQTAPLEVKDVWTRDTVGRTANAAIYMTITSPIPDRLIGASAQVARKTDLMTVESGAGMMGMKYVDAIDIPAGKPISLNPAGLHVWLAELRAPLKAGQSFEIVLAFEKGGDRSVAVSVIGAAETPPSSR